MNRLLTPELEYTGERMVPWDARTGPHIMLAHAARYVWALPFVFDKTVVDLGCGTGYGAFMLSWAARRVVGLDSHLQTVYFAQTFFEAENLAFVVRNLEGGGPLPPAEVYVAFEVLEHLEEPQRLLERLKNRLLLWSVPVDDGSQFHKRVYSASDAARQFGGDIWYQRGGVIVPRDEAGFAPEHVLGIVGY